MKKSKWDIIGEDIDKDNSEEYADYFYFWYDGVDPSGLYYGEDYIYEYLEPIYQDYIYRRGKIHVSIGRSNIGSYIDMMSIYDPQLLRQKKIDYLLGVDKWEILTKPTIGDLIKKNNENNEN
jgi:hypothetical protein